MTGSNPTCSRWACCTTVRSPPGPMHGTLRSHGELLEHLASARGRRGDDGTSGPLDLERTAMRASSGRWSARSLVAWVDSGELISTKGDWLLASFLRAAPANESFSPSSHTLPEMSILEGPGGIPEAIDCFSGEGRALCLLDPRQVLGFILQVPVGLASSAGLLCSSS